MRNSKLARGARVLMFRRNTAILSARPMSSIPLMHLLRYTPMTLNVRPIDQRNIRK